MTAGGQTPNPRLSAALAALRRNELAQAQSLLTAIVADEPGNARAQVLLGLAHARQGRLDEAERYLRAASALEPGMAEAWFRLGQILELGKRHNDAEAPLRRALELAPGLHEARESLGRILTRQCRYDEAIDVFERVLDAAPDRVAALDGLAGALRLAGRITNAYEIAARAQARAPEDALVQITLGRICHDLGALDESLQHYRNALRIAPGAMPAIYGAAEALERLGRPAEALDELRPLLPMLDDNAQLLVLYARICARLRPDEPIIGRLERALGKPALDSITRERILFLLGQLHDRAGSYDAAFTNYHAANESIWRRFGETGYQMPMNEVLETFDAAAFRDFPRSVETGIQPVYIVGMPRSGTSLVEQILASHPQVHGAGELNLIAVLASELGYGTPEYHPEPAGIQAMARRALDGLAKIAGGKSVITDKMPHNFLYLGLITLLFPNAKIIHTIRDPLDTCLSCYFQDFSGPNRYSYDLAQLGRYYRGYERLMEYWRELGIEFLDVRYEELVGDLEGVSRRMIAHCGLEWDEACLRFHENTRITATASYDQVNKPIYTSSIGRWRHYEKHLGPLKDALARPPGSE